MDNPERYKVKAKILSLNGLQRHGLSKLPEEKPSKDKKKFETYPIGYFHLDISEVQTEEGRLYLFTAIDRTSKFAYAELNTESTRSNTKLHSIGLL